MSSWSFRSYPSPRPVGAPPPDVQRNLRRSPPAPCALPEHESMLRWREAFPADSLRWQSPPRHAQSRRARTRSHPPSLHAAQKIASPAAPCASRNLFAESRSPRRPAADPLRHPSAAHPISCLGLHVPPRLGSADCLHHSRQPCVPSLEVNSISSNGQESAGPISFYLFELLCGFTAFATFCGFDGGVPN